jgi:hypothetical protein
VRQPVRHQGTSPAATPGAIARNTAVPAAAVIFRIGPTRQAVLIRPRSRCRARLHNARSSAPSTSSQPTGTGSLSIRRLYARISPAGLVTPCDRRQLPPRVHRP